MNEIKVSIWGKAGVGKTSFLSHLIYSTTFTPFQTILADDSYRRQFSFGQKKVVAEFCIFQGDTNEALQDLVIRNSDLVLIIYSVTSMSSFLSALSLKEKWNRILDCDDFPCILVGNKFGANEEVSNRVAEAKAEEYNCGFFEFNIHTANVEDLENVVQDGFNRCEDSTSRLKCRLNELYNTRKRTGPLHLLKHIKIYRSIQQTQTLLKEKRITVATRKIENELSKLRQSLPPIPKIEIEQSRFVKDLQAMFDNSFQNEHNTTFTDLNIKFTNKDGKKFEFFLHKFVIHARCPSLLAIKFENAANSATNDVNNDNNRNANLLEQLSQFDFDTWKSFFNYLYTSQLPISSPTSSASVKSFLQLCGLLDVPNLSQILSQFEEKENSASPGRQSLHIFHSQTCRIRCYYS